MTSSASTMDTSGTSVWGRADGSMRGGEALSSMVVECWNGSRQCTQEKTVSGQE